jgi:plasmid stabilization system protein ParE
MVKRLRWSTEARKELKRILVYWNEHNQSTSYSKKLRVRINNILDLIRENNYLGKSTSEVNVRLTIIDNFLIYYEILTDEILVIAIFDGRRNPFEK